MLGYLVPRPSSAYCRKHFQDQERRKIRSLTVKYMQTTYIRLHHGTIDSRFRHHSPIRGQENCTEPHSGTLLSSEGCMGLILLFATTSNNQDQLLPKYSQTIAVAQEQLTMRCSLVILATSCIPQNTQQHDVHRVERPELYDTWKINDSHVHQIIFSGLNDGRLQPARPQRIILIVLVESTPRYASFTTDTIEIVKTVSFQTLLNSRRLHI